MSGFVLWKDNMMFKKINYVLDRRQKTNLSVLLVIILIGAFVELLGVSAIMPLIDVAMEPGTIGEKWYFVLISKNTGITDANQMIVLLAFVLIAIYILKNIYVTMMYSLQYRFIFNNQQRLSVRMMKSYMQQDYLFHVSRNVAEFQRNIVNDVNGFYTVTLNALQFLAEFSVSVVLVAFHHTCWSRTGCPRWQSRRSCSCSWAFLPSFSERFSCGSARRADWQMFR